MKLYLDDDSASATLVQLLQRAGHDVLVPAGLGVSGPLIRFTCAMPSASSGYS
jgi:hypothetical protein